MKQSKEFKDAFKNVLKEDAIGGQGLFSYTGGTAGTTRSPRVDAPPFHAMTGLGDIPGKGPGGDELENAKAPANLPYPLDTINDFLADAYLSISNAEAQIQTVIEKNPVVGEEKKELLKHLHKKLQAMKNMTYEISVDIEKISLDI